MPVPGNLIGCIAYTLLAVKQNVIDGMLILVLYTNGCHICNRNILEGNRTSVIVSKKAGPRDNLFRYNERKQETLSVSQHSSCFCRIDLTEELIKSAKMAYIFKGILWEVCFRNIFYHSQTLLPPADL